MKCRNTKIKLFFFSNVVVLQASYSLVRRWKKSLFQPHCGIFSLSNIKKLCLQIKNPNDKLQLMFYGTLVTQSSDPKWKVTPCLIQSMSGILIWVLVEAKGSSLSLRMDKKAQGCYISISTKWLMDSQEVRVVSHFHLSESCQLHLSDKRRLTLSTL